MKKSATLLLLISFWVAYFVLFVIIAGAYHKHSFAETNIGPQMIDALKNHFL